MTPLAQLNDFEFRQVQKIVYDESGIAVSKKGRTLLSTRLRRRLESLRCETFSDYLHELTHSDREMSALMDAVSTKETSFFRTSAHFDWFGTEFLTQQSRRLGENPREVRVWSAACSTGEEAYSLAVVLLKNRLLLPDLNVRLLASDISVNAIERAREGIYSPSAVSKLGPTVQRYFEPHDAGLRVKPAVRDYVEFSIHNLMHPSPLSDLDCVFLRNVLIYFDDASREQALRNTIATLRVGGYLVTGPSEGVIHVPEGLERIQSFLFRRVA